MTYFVAAIFVISALSVVSDALILNYLIAAHEKPVRVWGRLGAFAYHLAAGAWSAALLAGAI